MPTLYLLKRYLSAIALADQTTMLFDSPTNDGRTFTVDGALITLDDIKQSQDRLLAQIESKLDELLWHQFHLPPGAKILDDPRNRSVGFSFATNLNNTWIGDSLVLRYIIPDWLEEFEVLDQFTPSGILWKPARCNLFMQEAFDIQRLLAIGIILTGG